MTFTILHGNNLDILPTLPDNSVDSIVTDPPYELGFMGKGWDSSGIAYSVQLWTECLRVLKPGGHLLSFGGTRTYHRMVVGIEDAGFEVRDMISWISNKTFPKSHNLKDEWAGWGTGLKPTVEPIVMARKPLIGTVAHNVLTHGTGALNIDGSRIGAEVRTNSPAGGAGLLDRNSFPNASSQTSKEVEGRWPANIILDEHTAGLLDKQSGHLHGSGNISDVENDKGKGYESSGYEVSYNGRANRDFGAKGGGASRFFYVAKASKRDRNEGLEDLPKKQAAFGGHGNNEQDGMTKQLVHAPRQNFHPTVKPTALMGYLVNLVTPPNGTVLDPFTGSGSTGKAAILNGFDFIGIEMTEDYLPIIKARLEHAETEFAEAQADKGLF